MRAERRLGALEVVETVASGGTQISQFWVFWRRRGYAIGFVTMRLLLPL